MQEQVTMATSSMNLAIERIKDLMGKLTNSSKEQTDRMMSELTATVGKLSTILEGTVSSVSAVMSDSFSQITDNITKSHADLIALQEGTTSKTQKLLTTFNDGLERLESLNDIVAGTMNQFQQVQVQITGTANHLQTITSDMKEAIQLIDKSQTEYQDKLSQLQIKSQQEINAVEELLRQSGTLSEEYVEKFEIIRQGLGGIFTQLQIGLTEYSRTVQVTTQKYLDQYSTSLTSTTDRLSSAISEQNDIVQMLTEILDKNRR